MGSTRRQQANLLGAMPESIHKIIIKVKFDLTGYCKEWIMLYDHATKTPFNYDCDIAFSRCLLFPFSLAQPLYNLALIIHAEKHPGSSSRLKLPGGYTKMEGGTILSVAHV